MRTTAAAWISRLSPAILGRVSTPAPAPTRANRPHRGSELELTVDRLAYGGNGVARREDGYVVFVAGAVPGDRVRAVVGKAKRAYAEARAIEILEPSSDRIEPRRRPPRRALAGAPLRAPARGQAGAGLRRADAHRPARGLRARADRPGARAMALPQQARVLVRRGPGRRAGVRLPRSRPLRPDPPADRLPARLRALQRRPRAGGGRAAPAGPRRLGPPRRSRASCATSSSARAAAPASCRSGSSPRPASSTPTR